MTLILTSNIIYILNNYTVSWFRLHATEVALVRGVLQVMISGVVMLLGNRKLRKLKHTEGINFPRIFPQIFNLTGNTKPDTMAPLTGNTKPDTITVYQWLLITLYGLLMSAVGLSSLAAIPLMPIGDLIVLCFTEPVFAVVFEFLILRRPIRIITVTLCCLIGEILQKI